MPSAEPGASSDPAVPKWPRRWITGLFAAAVLALAGVQWLRNWSGTPPAPEASTAVLPFAIEGNSPEDRDLAEGLGDELLDALARVEGLRVASRSSVYANSERSRDPRVLGPILHVATVVDVSVRREGTRMHLEARVSDTDSGATRWSQGYRREAEDLPALLRDLVVDIAGTLVGAGAANAATPALASVPAPTGYREFLRARRALKDATDADRVELAVGLFRKVVSLDGRFARARAGLCAAEVYEFLRTRDAQSIARARPACEGALDLEPALSEAHLAMGDLLAAEGQHEEAVSSYERALRDPALAADALTALARTYVDTGNDRLAAEYYQRAAALQPGYWGIQFDLGYFRLVRHDYEEGASYFVAGLQLEPPDWVKSGMLTNLGYCQMFSGEFESAAEAYEQAASLSGMHNVLSNYALLRYYEGAYDDAIAKLERAVELEPGSYRTRGNLGTVLAARPSTAQQAAAHFQQATELVLAYLAKRPDSTEAHASLAWYLANLNEVLAARKSLAVAEPGAADNPGTALKVALTHARLGEFEAARSFAEQSVRAGFSARVVYAEPLLAPMRADQAPVDSHSANRR